MQHERVDNLAAVERRERQEVQVVEPDGVEPRALDDRRLALDREHREHEAAQEREQETRHRSRERHDRATDGVLLLDRQSSRRDRAEEGHEVDPRIAVPEHAHRHEVPGLVEEHDGEERHRVRPPEEHDEAREEEQGTPTAGRPSAFRLLARIGVERAGHERGVRRAREQVEDRVARPERRRRLRSVERFEQLQSVAEMSERAVALVGEDRHERELAEDLRQLIAEAWMRRAPPRPRDPRGSAGCGRGGDRSRRASGAARGGARDGAQAIRAPRWRGRARPPDRRRAAARRRARARSHDIVGCVAPSASSPSTSTSASSAFASSPVERRHPSSTRRSGSAAWCSGRSARASARPRSNTRCPSAASCSRRISACSARSGKTRAIVSVRTRPSAPLRVAQQSHGFGGRPSRRSRLRKELEPARAQHGLGVRDLQERLDERAGRGGVVPLEGPRRVDDAQVPTPRMLGGKRRLDRRATRRNQIVVLDPERRREQEVGRLNLASRRAARGSRGPATSARGRRRRARARSTAAPRDLLRPRPTRARFASAFVAPAKSEGPRGRCGANLWPFRAEGATGAVYARMPRALVSAAEPSGDLLASEDFAAELRDFDMAGLAGPRMRAAGVRPLARTEDVSVMGIVELLSRLGDVRRVRAVLEAAIDSDEYACFVGVDAPELHLPLARRARERGMRAIGFVSPQVWAWRPSRVTVDRRSVRGGALSLRLRAGALRRHARRCALGRSPRGRIGCPAAAQSIHGSTRSSPGRGAKRSSGSGPCSDKRRSSFARRSTRGSGWSCRVNHPRCARRLEVVHWTGTRSRTPAPP